ncbi:GntR family transcriptional regulator [Gracilibacillus alcaliphilus]|uniref:GntR family transcriptional regulator n=1 Tax=Gracilibacillus alcaliphilus TaxID=1401441 RepID=UPI00195B1C41|nr:GntR family transcriptional regulator [Gracilibacillus alcaliphilus]MBM7676441.1 DNA-binding GntR family transcriptional regulator [Gracilibacillus alcaliphilus]
MEKQLIQVSTIGEEVYHQLKQRIITGKLKPGQRVTVRDLAQSMGVSTMPIRESLRKLEVEGFIHYQRRSVSVTHLSAKEVTEIFEIRKQLESMAIRWSICNVNKERETQLLTILEQMDEQLTNEQAWERLNKSFHLTLYSYADAKPLQDILTQIWHRVEPYMHLYALTTKDYSLVKAQQDHYQMLYLWQQKESDRLVALIKEHLEKTCQDILLSQCNWL